VSGSSRCRGLAARKISRVARLLVSLLPLRRLAGTLHLRACADAPSLLVTMSALRAGGAA
jgi:hypothetical protein